MNPPADSDDESTRSAYWQGVISTKIDNLTEVVKEMAEDKVKTHENHEKRIDSLESWRDSSKGFLIGAMFGAGILGGSLATAVGQLFL